MRKIWGIFRKGLPEETLKITQTQQFLRKIRKKLVDLTLNVKIASFYKKSTKSISEKEDEQVEKLLKREPKKKPPRYDLRNRRVEIEEDPDLKQDNSDEKDLSLNYKKVAKKWITKLLLEK